VLLRELYRVPTTADTIDENRDFTISNCFGYWNNQYNDAAPTVATITSATKEVLLCLNSALSNPSAIQYIPTFTNGTAGS
jgi:hypothetical protein